MLKKLVRPRLSKRELMIINECCRLAFESMTKEDQKNSLPPDIKQIQEDIQIIMKKLEPIA